MQHKVSLLAGGLTAKSPKTFGKFMKYFSQHFVYFNLTKFQAYI